MLRFLCDRNRHRAGWRFLRFTTTVTVKKSAEAEKRLDNSPSMPYNNHCCAGVAHLVERDLAKVEVASSSLVARSKKKHHPSGWCFFCIYRPGRGSNRARAKREKHAGGMFWCPRACGGPAGPPASLVARSKKKHHPEGWCFFFGINIHRRWSKNFIKSKISRVSSGVYPSSESCKALSMPSI